MKSITARQTPDENDQRYFANDRDDGEQSVLRAEREVSGKCRSCWRGLESWGNTYDGEEESTVEESAHAANEGYDEQETTGCHAEVTRPIISLNIQVLSVDPEARVAPHP